MAEFYLFVNETAYTFESDAESAVKLASRFQDYLNLVPGADVWVEVTRFQEPVAIRWSTVDRVESAVTNLRF